MASYCSLLYAGVFLPMLSCLAYGVLPQRRRSKVLLAASYVFFWSVSGKLVVFLLASTLSLHHCGLWLGYRAGTSRRLRIACRRRREAERRAVRARNIRRQLRRVLAVRALLLHIGTLLTLKYAAFFSANLDRALDALRLPVRCCRCPPSCCPSAFRSTPCRPPAI